MKAMYNNAKSFIFDGINSDNFDLLICTIDNDTPSYNTGLAREIKSFDKTMTRPISHQYGTQYSENLEFVVTVIHKDGSEFTRQQTRNLNSTYTSSSVPKLLHFNMDDDMYINYYATCIDIEDVVVSGQVGKKFTFKCNAPYGFASKITRVFDVTTSKIIKLNNDSDDGIYYPKVTIIPNTVSSTISIKNKTDGNKTLTVNTSTYTRILLDSTNLSATDQNGELIPAYDLGWNDSYNANGSNQIYWLKLLPNTNEIEITGNCKITVECEFPRKVGKM